MRKRSWIEFDSKSSQRDDTLSEETQNCSEKVIITLTKAGRKGKNVTLIKGLKASNKDLKILLINIKTLCGAGGSLKNDQIEIQGDQREKIVSYLKEIGYKVQKSGR
tara:strand:+ start:9138 stop:9458 length:321 start_codon:yes stop_codon:yes gene_type:complete